MMASRVSMLQRLTDRCQVPGARILLFMSLLLIGFGTLTESLMCFQCDTTAPDGDCIVDVLTMANATTRHKYAKNCTHSNPNWTQCMIQEMETDGKVKFYLRGCTDGYYFQTSLDSHKFHNLVPDNQTTCDMVASNAVCYTSCETDFCNGPQLLTEKNCTDPDSEECTAPAIFEKSHLGVVLLLGVLTSLMAVPWFVLGRY